MCRSLVERQLYTPTLSGRKVKPIQSGLISGDDVERLHLFFRSSPSSLPSPSRRDDVTFSRMQLYHPVLRKRSCWESGDDQSLSNKTPSNLSAHYRLYIKHKNGSLPTSTSAQNTPGITRYGTLAAHASHSAPNCFFRRASSVGARAMMLERTYASMAHQHMAYSCPNSVFCHPARAHHEPGPKCTSNVPVTPSTTPL